MQTVDDKKITHWLRHDNVDAWARWANTPNGKSYLSKDPAKWAKLIWQSKAWRCLREWSLMGQEETLSFDERAPEMLLSILLGEERRNAKKESKTPEHVWSLFKKVVEVSIEKGWRPSASWGWEVMNRQQAGVFDIKDPEWLKNVLGYVDPGGVISDAASHHTWVDWVLTESSDLADDLWRESLTRYPEETQKCHENWAAWALSQPRVEGLLLMRVGAALAQGRLTAPLPRKEYVDTVMDWVDSKETGVNEIRQIWMSWIDSTLLKGQAQEVLQTLPKKSHKAMVL